MDAGESGRYVPDEDHRVLAIGGFDRSSRTAIVSYIPGRGFDLEVRDKVIYCSPDSDDLPSPAVVEAVNTALTNLRDTCRELVWCTVRGVGDAPGWLSLNTVFDAAPQTRPTFVGVDLELLPQDLGGLNSAIEEIANGGKLVPEAFGGPGVVADPLPSGASADPSIWREDLCEPLTLPDEFPPQLSVLRPCEFSFLGDRTLVVCVEGYSDPLVEGFKNALLEKEIPGVGGGVNGRSYFIMPTLLTVAGRKMLYLQLNDLAGVDAHLEELVRDTIELELKIASEIG